MKVVVNGVNSSVGRVEVEVSIDELTRQFTIRNTEDLPSFYLDDEVEIYNSVGVLLIKGVIEYIAVEQERDYIYAGRNNAKYIVDCYADKTIQFSESQTVQTVLEEIAGRFDLKVIGQAKMPSNSIKTILVGDNFGKSLMKMARSSGQVLTSDAEGNIEIEQEPSDGVGSFVYGENIRSRAFKSDITIEYDKYLVVSQSNYLTNQSQEVDVRGEFGSGKFVKVICSEDNLTIKECEELAEKEYWKDRRKSIEYVAEIDSHVFVDVNTKYAVIDKLININAIMNVKKYVAILDANTDKLIVTFENIKNA